MIRRQNAARVPETLPYEGRPVERNKTDSGEVSSVRETASKYNNAVGRHVGQRRMRACTALGRAADKRAAARREGSAALGWQRPSEPAESGADVVRRSAFTPARSEWPELNLDDNTVDVILFEEIMLIRDERRMRTLGSKYIEQVAREYPDEPRHMLTQARRVFDVFDGPVPLSDRALAIIARYGNKVDARLAMRAVRQLMMQYPKSGHTASGMLVAAVIQAKAGRVDKSVVTLRSIVSKYPNSNAAVTAERMLSA